MFGISKKLFEEQKKKREEQRRFQERFHELAVDGLVFARKHGFISQGEYMRERLQTDLLYYTPHNL